MESKPEIEVKLLFPFGLLPGVSERAMRVEKITQTYLEEPDQEILECRVRSSTDEQGVTTYTYTTKKPTGVTGERIESEKEITSEQYEEFLNYRKEGWKTIRKCRHTFSLDSREDLLLQVDVYEDDLAPLVVGEVEFESHQQMKSFLLGDSFGLYIDITSDKRYSNAALARRGIPVGA